MCTFVVSPASACNFLRSSRASNMRPIVPNLQSVLHLAVHAWKKQAHPTLTQTLRIALHRPDAESLAHAALQERLLALERLVLADMRHTCPDICGHTLLVVASFLFFLRFRFCSFVHDKLSVTLRVSVRWPEAVCAAAGLLVAVLTHDRTILRSISGAWAVGVSASFTVEDQHSYTRCLQAVLSQ